MLEDSGKKRWSGVDEGLLQEEREALVSVQRERG